MAVKTERERERDGVANKAVADVQFMKASVSRAAFDCHGVTVAKVSTNQQFIAYATIQG